MNRPSKKEIRAAVDKLKEIKHGEERPEYVDKPMESQKQGRNRNRQNKV